MSRRTLIFPIFLVLCLVAYSADAGMKATGNPAPIKAGKNLLAAAAFNDSPGSSDLSLIIQLKADGEILIDEGSPCKAIEPKKDLPSKDNPTGWTLPEFDDSSWQDATYGVGYGDGDDNTVIGSKAANTVSVYTRAWFTIDDPLAIKTLSLGVDYDDAAVVWINGVEVARTSGTDIPEKPHWDSWSDKGSGHSHEASKKDPPAYEWVDLQIELVTAVAPAGKLALSWGELKKF
jgi:hypothetical protein